MRCVCGDGAPVCHGRFIAGIQGEANICVGEMPDGTMCGHPRVCHNGGCDCHSYNGDEGTVPERILDWREFFPEMAKDVTATAVCIDRCIADDVLTLWCAGIWTLNSCCGHGKSDRSIIVEHGESAEKARAILPARTKVLWWKLDEHTDKAIEQARGKNGN